LSAMYSEAQGQLAAEAQPRLSVRTL